jgi:hypothetical protein
VVSTRPKVEPSGAVVAASFCGGGGTPIFTCSSGDMVIPCLAADSPRPSAVAPTSNCKSLRQDLEPLLVLPSPTSSFLCGRPFVSAPARGADGQPAMGDPWSISSPRSSRRTFRRTPSCARVVNGGRTRRAAAHSFEVFSNAGQRTFICMLLSDARERPSART